MSDDVGCLTVFLIAAAVILTMLFMRANADIAGRAGYRRGYCEGRGGVEATVHDSIQCIQPPETVRTK